MNKTTKKIVDKLCNYNNSEKFVAQVCELLIKTNLITEEEASDIKIKHYEDKINHM